MNKNLYFKLARNNIKKNKNTFFPFALSATTMIALFYMIAAVTVQTESAEAFLGARSMMIVLDLGVWVCGIFSVAVIFYTNNFLMKQRSRELGLYSILGMEKRHIGKVLFWEITSIGGLSLAGGLFFGIVFSKLMFMLLVKLMKYESKIAFGIPVEVIARTFLIFAAVFVVNIVLSIVKLKFIKPIDLLNGTNKGEKEPKAKWFSAILGIGCLAIGYYLSLTTENPIDALNVFFMAVLFVIAGTYLVFMSGSIALLKVLKKNKKFYFHKTHFITVSSMMYRMKRNAVGLSNICILGTAVLVVLSSTVCLYVGIEDIIKTSYPLDVQTTYIRMSGDALKEEAKILEVPEEELVVDPKKVEDVLTSYAKENNITLANVYKGHELSTVVSETAENQFVPGYNDMTDMNMFSGMSLEEYNSIAVEEAKLDALTGNEVWVYDTRDKIQEGDTFTVAGITYTARIIPSEIRENDDMDNGAKYTFASEDDGYNYVVMLLPTLSDMEQLLEGINSTAEMATNSGQSNIYYEYSFNVDGNDADITNFCSGLRDNLYNAGIPHIATVGDVFSSRADYLSIYASVFFIGIFIGTMFLLTTVLIIYYKQVSEGYEDWERFEILQKVGMAKGEVKKVITTQIMQVFFLPILLASVHIAFAFPIIKRILAMMYMNNTQLFIGSTIFSILAFVAVYGVVYYLTAKVYYKIVYGGSEKIRGRK